MKSLLHNQFLELLNLCLYFMDGTLEKKVRGLEYHNNIVYKCYYHGVQRLTRPTYIIYMVKEWIYKTCC